MRTLFRLLKESIEGGAPAVMVTVVASSGSTPRGTGAHMLVNGRGRIRGTIGGGAVEHRAEQIAAHILETKQSHLESFCLRKNDIQDLGMICGGDVSVYFTYLAAGDEEVIRLTDQIEACYQRGVDSWLLLDVTEGGRGQMLLCEGADSREAAQEQMRSEGKRYYCDKLTQSETVYIFGGGHVAQALVPVLSAVDFRCVVLEDREEFCKPELFPGAVRTILVDPLKISQYVQVTEHDYACIMTRGHKDDMLMQAQMMDTPVSYIGVIGSAKKKAGVSARLKEMGYTDQDLARITTPIGLSIHAETPAEIAVSIAGQLIAVRAGRR
ncbi:MAG: xanthine dehydrogenase accessory protein XdhC [Lachnospiraceae bacterium]|nr:xanthine dehydrogenase accessory protein XdhC [Lachnospiraceae bacterium]